MLEHFKGDEIFVKKILDFKFQAMNHQRMILTPFYNPHEQDVVRKVIGQQELKVYSYGGFMNAENQRLIICPDFYDIQKEDFELYIVEVIYAHQFGLLKHKDVLGALMNLGIKRECIGDIYEGERLFFTCTKQTYPFIESHLNQIKKSKIKLLIINEEIEIKHNYLVKTFFVSSMRLDKLVSSLYHVSRQSASQAIGMGHVKVNHKEVEDVHYLCHNKDIISFKRHGRVKIVDEDKRSKQGNYVIKGYFYK